jgi:hypothetical protein
MDNIIYSGFQVSVIMRVPRYICSNKSGSQVRERYFNYAWLYKSDLDYLKENQIPVQTALRQALMDYVDRHKAAAAGRPSLKTKADRDRWILSAPDTYNVENYRPIVEMGPVIPRSSAPDMSAWTKKERDAWIIDGTVPARAMMARNETARACEV